MVETHEGLGEFKRLKNDFEFKHTANVINVIFQWSCTEEQQWEYFFYD